MKPFFTFTLFTIFCSCSFSQESKTQLYSGGMLIVQPGYLTANNSHQPIQDVSFGLGGILRFYFFGYLTAGIYGGTQRANYKSSGSQNSYISLGYGGPFIGFSRKAGKFRYTFSGFVGKGTIRNLHIEKQNQSLLTEAYFYRKPTTIISPILSIDYALSQRLLITFQTVCLNAQYTGNGSLYNPILQIGVLFNR
jgi:hypothetical protein